MKALVNGLHLYFDVEGASLRPDGASMAALPTLVLGGTLDPMLPIECQRDLAAALQPQLVRYREFEGCGHGVVPDAGDAALALLCEFIRSPAGSAG